MKSLVIAGLLLASSAAYGQCFGPGGCQDDVYVGPVAPSIPVGPAELCLGQDCNPVSYRIDGSWVIAESALSNGYPVMGFAGPFFGSVEGSPGIWQNAFQRLVVEARAANRAQRFGE